MCYSATLDANIREIVRDYVKNPIRVEIGTTSKPSDRVELRVYTVMQDQKLGLLDQMLREEEGTFLVFSRTKHGADRISKKLEKLGHDADVIHGDRSQSQRTAALKGFAERQAPRPRRHRRCRSRHRRPGHRARRQLRPAQRLRRLRPPHRPHRPRRREGRSHHLRHAAGKRHDARKLERELKIKFEWREADKNLEKEERNQPIDLKLRVRTC